MMNIYLVGGAVRDRLLGRPIREKDYVIVGATPELLIRKGFKPVGKDFPVFLHPVTHEEYALARTERKTAPGYAGFSFYAAPDVTLKQDLNRRDLTINAIAETAQGEIIDPYQGCQDLKDRRLRHVSDAFSEDPVRILRVARFMARFAHLGFQVADETITLMKQMVQHGEVDALVPERIWKEFSTALLEVNPEAFIQTLRQCGALEKICPELNQLFGRTYYVNQSQIDLGEQSIKVLVKATTLTKDPIIRFSALMQYIDTQSHEGRDFLKNSSQNMLFQTNNLIKRWRLPSVYYDLLRLSSLYRGHCHQVYQLSASEILLLFEKLDAFRRPHRVQQFLTVCEADWLATLSFPHASRYCPKSYLMNAYHCLKQISTGNILKQGLKGKSFGQALYQLRLDALEHFIVSFKESDDNGCEEWE